MKETINELELQEATPEELNGVVYSFLSAITLVGLFLFSIVGMLLKIFG